MQTPECPSSGQESRWRRLPGALALLAAPKCLVCAGAYAGFGAAMSGPELCGGTGGTDSLEAGRWLPLLAGLGLAAWSLRPRRHARPGKGRTLAGKVRPGLCR